MQLIVVSFAFTSAVHAQSANNCTSSAEIGDFDLRIEGENILSQPQSDSPRPATLEHGPKMTIIVPIETPIARGGNTPTAYPGVAAVQVPTGQNPNVTGGCVLNE